MSRTSTPYTPSSLDSLPTELLWSIYIFLDTIDEPSRKKLVQTSRTQFYSYWSHRLMNEFQIPVPDNAPLCLPFQSYWAKRCDKDFKAQPDLGATPYLIYKSIEFLNLEKEKHEAQSPDPNYQQQCKNVLNTLEAHPKNLNWKSYYLALLHLETQWTSANKQTGLNHCRDAMNSNSTIACTLWGYHCTNSKTSRDGIKKLEALAEEKNESALVRLVAIYLIGLPNLERPTASLTIFWNKKLNDIGNHDFDRHIGLGLSLGAPPFTKDPVEGKAYLDEAEKYRPSSPSLSH